MTFRTVPIGLGMLRMVLLLAVLWVINTFLTFYGNSWSAVFICGCYGGVGGRCVALLCVSVYYSVQIVAEESLHP